MEHAYFIEGDGGTRELQPVFCKDEDKEIQSLLHNNFDLLPGDQIDPESPCRWLLIKREMPVPDPYSGTDRWNIDFFFVDQIGTPTFVECKRYADTRARREVIGQMLEYAANGQHYWSKDDFRKYAEQTAKERMKTFEDCFKNLKPDITESADQFFQEVHRRLKAGEIRLIFFLERAPDELKRLVEFLNKQMELSEVLLVEARIYEGFRAKIVVPRVFGYNEEARAIRRQKVLEGERGPIATDWSSFAQNARSKGLGDIDISACRRIYDTCIELKAEISWGRGVQTASFSPKWKSLRASAAPFSVYSSGILEIHFKSLQSSDEALRFRNRFAELLERPLGQLDVTTYRPCSQTEWITKVEEIVAALKTALAGATAQPVLQPA